MRFTSVGHPVAGACRRCGHGDLGLRAGAAEQEAVRAAGRPARQGRHLGADPAGAGREDARPGQDQPERHPLRSRLRRRPHRDRPPPSAAPRPSASNTIRTWSSCRAPTRRRKRSATRATFIEGDIFKTDFSKANVITLYLLTSLNAKLRPIILEMRPGTRVASNSFDMGDWRPDTTVNGFDGCQYCTAHYWMVPAKVAGTWKLPNGELRSSSATRCSTARP